MILSRAPHFLNSHVRAWRFCRGADVLLFLFGDGLLPRVSAMDSRKKQADPAKPVPQNLLRKMIASGKSIESKATKK